MKKFYIEVQEDKIIKDICQKKVLGYIEFNANYLPIGINGGWFKFENNEIIEIEELNPNNIENRIKAEIDSFTMNLITEGLL